MTNNIQKGTPGSSKPNDAGAINAILKERVDKLTKSLRIGIIIGVVLNVFVIIYLSVLYSGFTDALQPEIMADAISQEVSSRIPELGQELETHLKNEAPELVNSLRDMVINESAPALRELLEKQILEAYDEFAEIGPRVLNQEIFLSLVQQNRKKIVTAAKNGTLDSPELAAEFEKQLVTLMGQQQQQNGKGQVAEDLKKSLEALSMIDTKLKTLSKKKQMTREEMLMNRLISSWWTSLDTEEYEISKADEEAVRKSVKESSNQIFDSAKDAIE